MEIGPIIEKVKDFITIAKPIVETLAPKLQESMKVFAERMIVLSEKYPSIEKFAKTIDKVSEVMGDVLYVLGINAEPASVIGTKVLKADKTVDEFNSTEDYINYLRDEVELDKKEFDSQSVEERTVYTIVGLALEADVIGEKLGVLIPAELVDLAAKVADIGKIVFDGKEIVQLISSCKEKGVDNLNDVSEYFYGEGESDRIKTYEVVKSALEEVRPNESNEIINEITKEVRE